MAILKAAAAGGRLIDPDATTRFDQATGDERCDIGLANIGIGSGDKAAA